MERRRTDIVTSSTNFYSNFWLVKLNFAGPRNISINRGREYNRKSWGETRSAVHRYIKIQPENFRNKILSRGKSRSPGTRDDTPTLRHSIFAARFLRTHVFLASHVPLFFRFSSLATSNNLPRVCNRVSHASSRTDNPFHPASLERFRYSLAISRLLFHKFDFLFPFLSSREFKKSIRSLKLIENCGKFRE